MVKKSARLNRVSTQVIDLGGARQSRSLKGAVAVSAPVVIGDLLPSGQVPAGINDHMILEGPVWRSTHSDSAAEAVWCARVIEKVPYIACKPHLRSDVAMPCKMLQDTVHSSLEKSATSLFRCGSTARATHLKCY